MEIFKASINTKPQIANPAFKSSSFCLILRFLDGMRADMTFAILIVRNDCRKMPFCESSCQVRMRPAMVWFLCCMFFQKFLD